MSTKTGEVKVLRLVSANDSGRVINRKTYDSQVYGGMTQGLGYALTEKRVMDRQTERCAMPICTIQGPGALDVPVFRSPAGRSQR
jgi:xanthine dehydrogenase YagR molybdenum-binding subunit